MKKNKIKFCIHFTKFRNSPQCTWKFNWHSKVLDNTDLARAHFFMKDLLGPLHYIYYIPNSMDFVLISGSILTILCWVPNTVFYIYKLFTLGINYEKGLDSWKATIARREFVTIRDFCKSSYDHQAKRDKVGFTALEQTNINHENRKKSQESHRG